MDIQKLRRIGAQVVETNNISTVELTHEIEQFNLKIMRIDQELEQLTAQKQRYVANIKILNDLMK